MRPRHESRVQRLRLQSNVDERLHPLGPAGHGVNEIAPSAVDEVTQNMESGIEKGGKNRATVTLRFPAANNGGANTTKSRAGKNAVLLCARQPQRARQRIKRGKTISQDYCSLTLNGEKKELAVTELKNKILELLNYPKEFSKKQNIIYTTL